MQYFYLQLAKVLMAPLWLIFLFFPVLPIFAQTEGSLNLITSPLPISLTTEPGTSVSTELKIKNGGLADEELKITLMKFRAYEASGKPQLIEREAGDDFLDWVRFSESVFTVGPNEWKTVTATFDIPKEASFGYYYALVFSRAEEEMPQENRKTAIVGGTAVLVLLEARIPDAKRQVEVTEFSLDHAFYEFLPTTFTVRLKNTGNVHIAPRGNIFVGQGKTRDLAILEINREKGNILPNSSREFDTIWSDGFPLYENKVVDDKVVLDKNGQAEKELTWDWHNASKLRIGKYTAKMLLIYDDGQRDIPIEGEVSFWVVPWRFILGAFVIFAFVFIGIRSTFRSIWRKIMTKDVVGE